MFSNISRIVIWWLWITQSSAAFGLESQQPMSLETFRQSKSEEMLRYMNESVDPCEDFYEFACGNYAKFSPSYIDMPSAMPSLEKNEYIVNSRIKKELETDDDSDTEAERRMKSFYKSCLKISPTTYTIENRVAFVKELGKMPILEGDQWEEDNFDWLTTSGEIFHCTSVSPILGVNVITDFFNNSIHRVHILESRFVDDRFRTFNDEEHAELRKRKLDRIINFLSSALGIEIDLAKQTAREINDFEIALARGCSDPNQLSHYIIDTSPLTAIDAMQEKYLPHMDSKKFLSIAFDFIPSDLYVQHEYVENALKVIAETPKRIVANFIFYNYFAVLPLNFIADKELSKNFCFHKTYAMHYKTMDSMYFRKHITADMIEHINRLWLEMKTTFESRLNSPSLTWLQEDTRKQALEKLNAMRLTIAASADSSDDKELAQLNISDHDHLNNTVLLLALQAKRNRAKLQAVSKPMGWASYSPNYSRSNNAIMMPVVSVEQFYASSNSTPNACNFATMGFVLGHEMQHGFDAARRYDAQGNIRNWWDIQSDREYLERTQCFIDQYKKYTLGGQPLPEMKYQAENIADIGGLSTAYAAYLQWLESAVTSEQSLALESLPGMNYCNKQLFFISYGQWWCSTEATFDYASLKVASHVPEKLRVNGPLSNFQEFSKAFNCPAGSAMNPKQKCKMY